jgi:23S rRNA pseudouridine2605 synthase
VPRSPDSRTRQPEGGANATGPGDADRDMSGNPPDTAGRPGRRNRGRRGERPQGAGGQHDGDGLPAWASGDAVGLDTMERRRGGAPSAAVALTDEDHPKLHKVLADAGLGSRRDMEELIIAGRVSVNGQPAHIGQRIGPNDQVRVNGRPIPRRNRERPPRVLLYHKPSGEICTRDDPEHRATVFERLPRLKGARWVAVGRLDFNTEGLLVFTTSGDIANKLMHPRYGWEREYAVRIVGRIDEEARGKLVSGVELDDGPANFSSIEELGGDGLNAWYRVTLSEGRNREVRRMFDAVGLTVSRLVRLRFGPVALPRGLPRARWAELSPTEVIALGRLIRAASGEAPAADEDGSHPEQHDDWDDDDEDPADAIGNRAEPEEERVLAPHEIDDDWQPDSSNAHQEGITRVVRSGDGLPGRNRARRGRPGGRTPGQAGGFSGPMDHGRPAGASGFISGPQRPGEATGRKPRPGRGNWKADGRAPGKPARQQDGSTSAPRSSTPSGEGRGPGARRGPRRRSGGRGGGGPSSAA